MVTIAINGIIGLDVKSADIKKQIKDAGSEDKTFEVHSPGGSVVEGIAIYNAIKQSKGNSKVKVIGLAASMGSIIALAKGKPEVSKRSVFMIHNAQTFAMGDYRDMQKSADLANRMSELMASIYADETGKSKKSIRDMMDAETYMFGEEIKTQGFAGSIYDDGTEENQEDAIAMAELEMEECTKKMTGYKEDFVMAAQLIPEFTAQHSETPATAGQNNQEETSMNLDEFLKSNPAAKSEYDAIMTASIDGEVKKVKADYESRITKATAAMKAEKSYPEAIKVIALDVLAGTKSVETLDAMMAGADMFMEMQKSLTAQTEQKPDNKGEMKAEITEGGVVKTEADLSAAVAQMRKDMGIGGNK